MKSHSWWDLSARSKPAQPDQAAQAAERTEAGFRLRRGRVQDRRGQGDVPPGQGQQSQGGGVPLLAGRGVQAVVADLGQTLGQDVLEEALDKLFDGQTDLLA